jgi:hypothetical protein
MLQDKAGMHAAAGAFGMDSWVFFLYTEKAYIYGER